ncbi:hypothetical protein [Erysipelothrix larvae]|nr:hypothetical protein [Erysipelothrix larvae]
MIENFNDMISFIAIVSVVIGSIFIAFKIDKMFRKTKDDEYYQDLL